MVARWWNRDFICTKASAAVVAGTPTSKALMDKKEARKILVEVVSALRKLPYEQLLHLRDEPDVREMVGISGARYQVEVMAFADDPKTARLRVSVGIDDGGWRAFFPLTDGFVIAPDGSFVGERASEGAPGPLGDLI